MRAGREREGETNSSFGLFQFNNARRGKKQVIYFPGLEFRLPRSAFLPSRASLQFLCHIVVVFLRHKPFCELLSWFSFVFLPLPPAFLSDHSLSMVAWLGGWNLSRTSQGVGRSAMFAGTGIGQTEKQETKKIKRNG